MNYNLDDETGRKQATHRFQKLMDTRKRIELTQKREKRSLNQNSYLHLLLAYFAIETGYTTEYVKRMFFKKECSPELFIIKVKGKLGVVKDLRSSADLDTEEMTLAITRFKNWSSQTASVLLPEAEDMNFIAHCENEVKKFENRQYL